MIASVPLRRLRRLLPSLANMLTARRSGHGFPEKISALRIAIIADTFTVEGLAPECDITLLTPSGWRSELGRSQPHLVLVESCWHGARGEWRGLVQSASTTLRRLVSHCRRRKIPTVYWGKEDPTHWEDFLTTARLFDWVFTTDADCVERYVQALGHDRVDVLQFAIQPKLHHPIATDESERVPGAMFAGAWYENFPKRCAEFTALADGLARAGPFHIYRRQVPDGQTADYPAKYAPYLRPGVSYGQLGDLYRAYEIGLTINTVTNSPTMFARRAIELLGCGTRVVSNRCRAIEDQLGSLVEVCETAADAETAAKSWLANGGEEARSDFRVRAVRTVHANHDWRSRLLDLVRRIDPNAGSSSCLRPEICVVARVFSELDAYRVAEYVEAQLGVRAELWLQAPEACRLPVGATRVDAAGGEKRLSQLFGHDALIAPLHPSDWYGPHYLLDLALGTRFGFGSIVGKACYLATSSEGGLIRMGCGREYRTVGSLAVRRAVFHASGWDRSLTDLLDAIAETVEGPGLISMDGLSYIENGGRGLVPGSFNEWQGGQA